MHLFSTPAPSRTQPTASRTLCTPVAPYVPEFKGVFQRLRNSFISLYRPSICQLEPQEPASSELKRGAPLFNQMSTHPPATTTPSLATYRAVACRHVTTTLSGSYRIVLDPLEQLYTTLHVPHMSGTTPPGHRPQHGFGRNSKFAQVKSSLSRPPVRALFGGGCGLYGEEELESSSDEMKSFVWFDRYIMLRAGYPSYVLDA